jgi:hypothetical protein
MDVDLRAFTVAGLLRLYSEIVEELVRRKACRSTNNPVADIAEMLVIKALRLTPAAKSTKGYDAIDGAGKRYEVKARRITRRNPSRMLSAIRDCEARHFDFLAGVLFREDFSFDKACLVPFEVVLQRSTYRDHVNAHLFHLKDDLWAAVGVVDITQQVAAALASLDARANAASS